MINSSTSSRTVCTFNRAALTQVRTLIVGYVEIEFIDIFIFPAICMEMVKAVYEKRTLLVLVAGDGDFAYAVNYVLTQANPGGPKFKFVLVHHFYNYLHQSVRTHVLIYIFDQAVPDFNRLKDSISFALVEKGEVFDVAKLRPEIRDEILYVICTCVLFMMVMLSR